MTTTQPPRRHTTLATDLGDLLAVAEGDALAGLYFPAHWHPPAEGTIGPRVSPTGDTVFVDAARELAEYLRGERTTFTVATVTHGDAFSERVWDHLATLDYGTTTTYGAIARELGNAGLAQRVGQAVGHNPISILIPCHRVVGADGSLTGYAGGLDRKARLLALEEPPEAAESRLF
ncbi:methylated-DNA--[protein]-cysteine S-methyltransferase [Janibacter sp. HTCC2649]|uniref:methylated-DNA--[protein]-cysteine S-methyltransferase n=1 Tax=Janibacter sp. HTCC2649 TaxID=313589 RepID=UPI000680D0A5|nr:methylated-DNA--[protein]-cysteine S-methyltransferase [Janibacter sp. HTCC2649]